MNRQAYSKSRVALKVAFASFSVHFIDVNNESYRTFCICILCQNLKGARSRSRSAVKLIRYKMRCNYINEEYTDGPLMGCIETQGVMWHALRMEGKIES